MKIDVYRGTISLEFGDDLIQSSEKILIMMKPVALEMIIHVLYEQKLMLF